jgi:hypothetical protein
MALWDRNEPRAPQRRCQGAWDPPPPFCRATHPENPVLLRSWQHKGVGQQDRFKSDMGTCLISFYGVLCALMSCVISCYGGLCAP